MSEAAALLDALAEALRNIGQYNKDDQAPPAAIRWTDRERQWSALLPRTAASAASANAEGL